MEDPGAADSDGGRPRSRSNSRSRKSNDLLPTNSDGPRKMSTIVMKDADFCNSSLATAIAAVRHSKRVF